MSVPVGGRVAEPQERPGLGLVLVGAGVLAAAVCFFAVSWAVVALPGGNRSFTFDDLRDVPALSTAAQHYLDWMAFCAVALSTLLAVLAAVGLGPVVTSLFRVLAVVAAFVALLVHYVGVSQVFEGSRDSMEPGVWLVYAAEILILVGAWIGPRRTAPTPLEPSSQTSPFGG